MQEHNYDTCHNYTCRKKCEKNGYINAIDDAIEKFLEYGCFCIEWNPKLSKERLVDDVLRQVKGQSVYILEKLKQNAEEYNQSLTNNNQSLANGDKIRNMTNEELADFLSVNAFCDCCSIHDKCDSYQEDSCKNVFIKWLQSKAEE